MSEYRDEVFAAVNNRGPAWNAIRAWHESILDCKPQTLEAMKHGAKLIESADAALLALVELGVRLGLEAAAKIADERDEYVTGERIRDLDPAAVLRKERS